MLDGLFGNTMLGKNIIIGAGDLGSHCIVTIFRLNSIESFKKVGFREKIDHLVGGQQVGGQLIVIASDT